MNDRERWNERYARGHGSNEPNPRLPIYLKLLRPGLALDLAGGSGKNGKLLAGCQTVLVDISDLALEQARGMRVMADAADLPFEPAVFDTILCTYFFDPRVDFAQMLKLGGTLFFETYTTADRKYRPDFPATYRLEPSELRRVFRGLETVAWEENDNGERVTGTFVGCKR